jgi:hypothetical protein
MDVRMKDGNLGMLPLSSFWSGRLHGRRMRRERRPGKMHKGCGAVSVGAAQHPGCGMHIKERIYGVCHGRGGRW